MSKSFEESVTELDNIVNLLESNDLTLEDAIEKYKSGMSLAKDCHDILSKNEELIVKLMNEGKEEEFK